VAADGAYQLTDGNGNITADDFIYHVKPDGRSYVMLTIASRIRMLLEGLSAVSPPNL
jgi:hypothetical protein